MALYHFSAKVLSRGSRNTVGAISYRAGCELYDQQTGQTFNYGDKAVQHVELVLPKDAPGWAIEIQKLMAEDRQKGVQAFVDIVEAAEKRVDSQVWREFEFALHRELTEEQNKTLAREFVQDQLSGRGMAAQLNFHFEVDELTGEEKPHCHVTVTTRRLVEHGLSEKKEVEWDKKAMLFDLREQWANYSNFHLKLHGHDVQIDHRSNKERGIEMEPQPKQGKGILEQETRNQSLTLIDPVTDKAQSFYDVQLRNLYRIMKNPEVVLEIVTKHHGTFMWADVQKKLHQYVDDAHLFDRLEVKLLNSKELLTLRYEPKNPDQTIYTTHRMLAAEKSLVETAEKLGKIKSHAVDVCHTENAIHQANEELKKHGGLSEDQVKAIHHLVDEGQIKCVVGIAGAGKTTALGVCNEIWKNEGYNVYGLTPTGKAAQNLEQSGIESTTLHKFLKSYREGRCQYDEKSVLVLDEAGMVDMGRFEKLLGAAKELGTKLIIVGDGAQLQPVEAGPAFRLVTTRLGKSELNTVLRQKEDWQRQATVLFGKQETRDAIQTYADKGFVHIVEEELSFTNKPEGIVKLYEVAHRVSALMYREMLKETREQNPEAKNIHQLVRIHQDYKNYCGWKETETDAIVAIFKNAEDCRPVLEARCLDPLKLAEDLDSDFFDQIGPREFLKEKKLDHLIGIQRPTGIGVEVRAQAKEALIQSWHNTFKACSQPSDQEDASDKSTIMLAYSNRDVNDLNRSARSLLKESGHLSKSEFTYTIKREVEDDFGRKRTLQEEKGFSKGDRIVFTKNKYWSGVKNGTMGTIMELDTQKIRVQLDEGKELSFAPNLNPYFDHGWATTIHKSQGTTVDRTFVLASYEMTQNLAYVAMTRHREDVHVFGSSRDFWRDEKLPQVLAKSGEKLSAADYLDAESLSKLMKKDDHRLTEIFQRMSHQLEAMGAVTKQAFWNIADHFLGMTRERDIQISSGGIREEVRAEELFREKAGKTDVHQSASSIFLENGNDLTKFSAKNRKQTSFSNRIAIVDTALKQSMADFSDHIFSSIGEPLQRGSDSSTQRRYGKGDYISVNLRTGKWHDFKASIGGGPLQMLEHFKNMNSDEALDYGADWARLSPEQLRAEKRNFDHYNTQKIHKENREKEAKETQEKIKRGQNLWIKGQAIQGTIAERYLKEHRKIESGQEWPQDFRYLPNVQVIEEGKKANYPCLMVAARSNTGEVTAVQLTFLGALTANKADVTVKKKSHGRVTGSSVTIQVDKSSSLLFIAEGVETALSLKESGLQGTIKASLGLSNIARIEPKDPNTHIIICGDHDGPDSSATKAIEKSAVALRERGFKVSVIKPDHLADIPRRDLLVTFYN